MDIVGKGKIDRGKKIVIGSGESLPQVMPNLHYTDQNLIEILFSQPGGIHITKIIHQNTFY